MRYDAMDAAIRRDRFRPRKERVVTHTPHFHHNPEPERNPHLQCQWPSDYTECRHRAYPGKSYCKTHQLIATPAWRP